MDGINSLALGLGVALTAHNLACAFAGCLLGTLSGVLPGLGAAAAIAMLLPWVHALDATAVLIVLAGVFCGVQHGGGIRAILGQVPGTSPSAVAALEGHPMARQGRAGAALAVAALGSWFAGCVGTAVIAGVAPLLSSLALGFAPADRFALVVLALTGAVVMASGSRLKSLAMTVLGLLLSMVGADALSGTQRLGLGVPELSGGISFVVIAVGLFALSDVIDQLAHPAGQHEAITRDVNGLWPGRKDAQEAAPAVLRGTALGALRGLLPGVAALRASWASYAMEKRLAGARGRFGKGDIRGVAGPESARSAGAQSSFIALLALGIPLNAVMALVMGALLIKGIQPGPQLIGSQPSLWWGLIASMGIAQTMLLMLNVPLIGVWIRLLTVPYRHVFAAVTLLCCIGVYALRGSAFDVGLMAGFAAAGYVLRQLGCDLVPLLLGFVLGPSMEGQLRGALALSQGDWGTFVSHPLSAGLLAAAALLLVAVLLPSTSRERDTAFHDAD